MSRALAAALCGAWLCACEPVATAQHPAPAGVSASARATSPAMAPRVLVGTDQERCHAGIARTILGQFRDTVRVTAHVTRADPKLDALATQIEKLFDAISSLAPGKVVIAIDSGEEGSLVFEHGGQRAVLPLLDADASVEYRVASKLRELFHAAEGKKVRVGLVTGKREIRIDGLEHVMPFYELVPVNLASEIDTSLEGLVITQPGIAYTDEELRRVDRFVMQGRALAVFASAVNTRPVDTKMRVRLDPRGLERLLAGYGVEMERATVLDGMLAFTSNGLHAPAVVMVPHVDGQAEAQTLDDTFPVFFRLGEVAFPMASPLLLHPERQPGATLRVVARSSAEGHADARKRQRLRPAPKITTVGTAARRTLAVEITGPMKSAFGETRSTGSPTVLVVASAQFLANPFSRAGNPRRHTDGHKGNAPLQRLGLEYAKRAMTSILFRNTLDWMTTDELVIACSGLPR